MNTPLQNVPVQPYKVFMGYPVFGRIVFDAVSTAAQIAGVFSFFSLTFITTPI